MTGRDLTLAPLETQSAVTTLTAGAATITLTFPTGTPHQSHWRAAVEFYSDSAGATKVTPTSGTVTVTVKLTVLPNDFLSLSWEQSAGATPGVVNLAVRNEPVDWDGGGIVEVKAVMATIAGGSAAYCRFRARGDGV